MRIALLLFLAAGCGGGKTQHVIQGDAGPDSDADVDTDSDSDADTDSESESASESESDTGSESETASETDTGSDTDTGAPGAVGDPCNGHDECASGICRFAWPDGYCVEDCNDVECPAGSLGLETDHGRVCTCLDACADISDCRDGYDCVAEDVGTVCEPL